MKEQTLIEMKNKIETLGLINQKLISELNQTATIAIGVLETIKQMPWIMIKRSKELRSKLLNKLVRQKRLTPWKRLATRSGYMGSGFLIAAQWTIDPKLYIVGFILVVIQTSSRKQWNLVALNINGLIAWLIHLIK